MEASPLVKAHDHARAASAATHTSDTTVAINEHTSAAGEFSNAAGSTTSIEALRTLKLLEQHHQRLSELLQLPFKRPAANDPSSPDNSQNATQHHSESNSSTDVQPASDDPDALSAPAVPSEKSSQPMPTLANKPAHPTRHLGASIASNLASARGIRAAKSRAVPLTPSVSNTEAPGNVDQSSRRSGPKSKMQTLLDHSDKSHAPHPSEKGPRQSHDTQQALSSAPPSQSASASDDGFSKFYSAFGNIINRISAPLAFAGLPLINEEQPEEAAAPSTTTSTPESPVQKRIRLKASPSVATEPDLAKYYSKATVRAMSRDGPSPADSFYVVPPSGHTASYASILSYADKEKRRNEILREVAGSGVPQPLHDDAEDEDFVDARESQASNSPGSTKRSAPPKDLRNAYEEVTLENKSLKSALDQLSKRLHAFESISQNTGMRLAESMRLIRPSSPSFTGGGAGSGHRGIPAAAGAGGSESDEALAAKNRELEAQLVRVNQQMEELNRDYDKARANLGRYRERWEQLKAGAKARRSTNGASGSGTANGSAPGSASASVSASGPGALDDERASTPAPP